MISAVEELMVWFHNSASEWLQRLRRLERRMLVSGWAQVGRWVRDSSDQIGQGRPELPA